MTNITYNNQNLPSPLPLVGKQDSVVFVGERWAIKEVFTLQGKLVSCDGYQALLNSGKALLNIFNKSFQDFVIQENAAEIIRRSGVFIENVSFDNSNYVGALPYTVTLSCYPHSIQQVFGILDPVDSWNYTENKDGSIQINHNVGARSYRDLNTAIDFVRNRTGSLNYAAPQFINLTGSFVLNSQEETLNRLQGIYNVQETYVMDNKSSGLLSRYTFNLSSGLEGFIQASLEGTVNGGLNSTLNDLRNRYNTLNINQKISGLYSQATDLNDLNLTPLTSGITEDRLNKKLTFNLTYDNNPNSITTVDWNTNISSGDDTLQVSVNGRVYGRGEQINRWNRIRTHFAATDIYALAQSGYNYFGGNRVLNPKPLTSGTSLNQFASEISFNVSFNDRDQPPFGFSKFNYAVNITPSLRKIIPKQIAAYDNPNESFYIVDLNFYSRPRVQIQGTAILEENVSITYGKDLLLAEINRLFYEYVGPNATLENKQITFNPNFGRELSFDFAWICDSVKKVNYEPRFDVVGDLELW